MNSTLTIKYLSTFPVYTYFDPLNLPEAVMVEYEPNISKTQNIWGHVYDNVRTNRTIQNIGYEVYEIEKVFAMNINLNQLVGSNHVYVETDTGDTFYATDLTIEAVETASRDTFYTITFKRQIDFKYELSSDFAETLHPNLPVNVLNYKVQNPSYAFNNITTYIIAIAGFFVRFKVPLTGLTDTILVGDDYYLHTNNVDFNAEQDDAGDYFNYATCEAKSATEITFSCSGVMAITPGVFTINNLVINHEASFPAIPSGITVEDKEIEADIYTFINPIYSNIDTDEDEITKKELIKYKGRTVSETEAYLKCWLTTAEMWKAKYLRYANEITLTLASGLVIVPITKTDVIEPEEKETLVELYEFNLRLRYEHQVINNNRDKIY